MLKQWLAVQMLQSYKLTQSIVGCQRGQKEAGHYMTKVRPPPKPPRPEPQRPCTGCFLYGQEMLALKPCFVYSCRRAPFSQALKFTPSNSHPHPHPVEQDLEQDLMAEEQRSRLSSS